MRRDIPIVAPALVAIQVRSAMSICVTRQFMARTPRGRKRMASRSPLLAAGRSFEMAPDCRYRRQRIVSDRLAILDRFSG